MSEDQDNTYTGSKALVGPVRQTSSKKPLGDGMFDLYNDHGASSNYSGSNNDGQGSSRGGNKMEESFVLEQ